MPAKTKRKRPYRPAAVFDSIIYLGEEHLTRLAFALRTGRSRETIDGWIKIDCPPIGRRLPEVKLKARVRPMSRNRDGRYGRGKSEMFERSVGYIKASFVEAILRADAQRDANIIERNGKQWFWQRASGKIFGVSEPTLKLRISEAPSTIGRAIKSHSERPKGLKGGERIYWPLEEVETLLKAVAEATPKQRTAPPVIERRGKQWGSIAHLADLLHVSCARVEQFIEDQKIKTIRDTPPRIKECVYGLIEDAETLRKKRANLSNATPAAPFLEVTSPAVTNVLVVSANKRHVQKLDGDTQTMYRFCYERRAAGDSLGEIAKQVRLEFPVYENIENGHVSTNADRWADRNGLPRIRHQKG